MAKLLAFWSGLSLSGASRIEVHAIKNQRTNTTSDFEEEAALVTQPPPRCHAGDHVVCSDGSQCSGNQCCSDGSACPSADDDFTGCPQGKTVDCTRQQSPGCEACSGAESDCCVETQGYPPETAAIRCINPSIDVCHDGFVCPLSKPSVCREYTCMNPSGDATCFNPETHACVQPHGGRCPANQVCAIGSVVCGGACHDENSGVCCGTTWYRTEERKQCCRGRCQGGGCQMWACNADLECVRPFEIGYSDDPTLAATRNCRRPTDPVEPVCREVCMVAVTSNTCGRATQTSYEYYDAPTWEAIHGECTPDGSGGSNRISGGSPSYDPSDVCPSASGVLSVSHFLTPDCSGESNAAYHQMMDGMCIGSCTQDGSNCDNQSKAYVSARTVCA